MSGDRERNGLIAAEPHSGGTYLETESPVVGRRRERTLLRELFHRAGSGQSGFVLCSGEAGVGKTTLVDDLARYAVDQDARVLIGHCYDLNLSPPLGPWIEILQKSGCPDLLQSVSESIATDHDDSRARSRTELFESVLECLRSVAEDQLHVLVLEDLHWSDQSSLILLHYAASRLVDEQLLIVATHRAEFDREHLLYEILPAFVRDCRAERVELQPLDAGNIGEIVDSQYRLDGEGRQRLVDYLQLRTEGNPFFIRELLRTLESEGALSWDGDRWDIADLDRVRVPPLVRQVIDGRLAGLERDVRAALEAGSVIGHELPFTIWCAVTGLDEGELLERVRPAWQAGFLIESDDGLRVRFSHPLIREVLYLGLIVPERRRHHMRAGEALTKMPAPDPHEVAYHFQRAGDGRALEWLLRAGFQAERRYDWSAAVQRYEAALEMLADDRERVRERGWLAYHTARLVRYSDLNSCLQLLEEASQIAKTDDDPLLGAVSLIYLGFVRRYHGDFGAGISQMREAVETMERATLDDYEWLRRSQVDLFLDPVLDHPNAIAGGLPSRLVPRPGLNVLHDSLNLELSLAGRFQEALDSGRAYVEGIFHVEEDDILIQRLCYDSYFGLGIAHFAVGDPDQALAWLDRAVAAYQTVDHRAQVGLVNLWKLRNLLVFSADETEDRNRLLDSAIQALDAARGVAEREPALMVFLDENFDLALIEERWDEAREIAMNGMLSPHPWGRISVMPPFGSLKSLDQERELAWEEVHRVLPDGIATEPGERDFFQATRFQRLAAALAIDERDLEKANQWIEAHDRWLDWSGALYGRSESHLLHSACHRVVGDLEAARECACAALRIATEPRQPLSMLAAHRAVGQLATLEEQFGEAEEHLRAALALSDACEAPFERALSLLALAELHATNGRSTEALGMLDRARNLCRQLDATPLLSTVEALARTLTREPDAPGVSYPAGLSERELQVLRLLARGASNRNIAARLFISVRTVERHVSNIYTKIGTRGRAAATNFAVEHDLT